MIYQIQTIVVVSIGQVIYENQKNKKENLPDLTLNELKNILETAPHQDHQTDTPCLVGQCCDWSWSFTQGWYCTGRWRVAGNGSCYCEYAGMWDANVQDVTGVKGRKGGRIKKKKKR